MTKQKHKNTNQTCRVKPAASQNPQSKRRRAPGTGRMSYVREPRVVFLGGDETQPRIAWDASPIMTQKRDEIRVISDIYPADIGGSDLE